MLSTEIKAEINFLMKPGVLESNSKKYHRVFVHQNVVDQVILCNELAMKTTTFWYIKPCDTLEV